MRLKGLSIISPFVAEQPAKRVGATLANQAIPIIMAALVPHVAEQRAIRLVQCRPPSFTFRVIGFCDVDRNDASSVTGEHRRCALFVSLEFEGQPLRGVFLAAVYG